MSYPDAKISVVANTWIKAMRFNNVGDTLEGHAHTFNHQTVIANGKIRVTVEGKDTDFEAPQVVFIQAGKEHKLTALEAGSMAFCVHALHSGEKEEDIIDPDSIPVGANIAEYTTPIVPQIPNDFVKQA